MKKLLRSKILWLLAGVGILGLIVSLGIVEPRGKIGYAVFRSVYALPSSRQDVLHFYNWSLQEYNGGYVPLDFDDFLTNRLSDCEGSEEESAIIDFQIRQRSGRWGSAAFHAHEDIQHQIISNIMGRLDSMYYPEAVCAMLMVEGLRRNNSIGKGGFSGMNPNTFELAKSKFRIWWDDGRGWPHNRPIDPLGGSGLEVYDGP